MNAPPQKNYYALLVGINDYPDPFSSLNGCIKDIDNIEAYLEEWIQTQIDNPAPSQSSFKEEIPVKHIGPLQILKLENEQASYENICLAFQKFLAQAQKYKTSEGTEIEDVVWFHFSGHGSEEFTAEEFLELEPNGKDQTLVTYNKSYGEGHTHLADKEIAVLLHQIATLDVHGNPKESPHIVVSLDCCHSGSGTRFMDFEIKTRNADVLPTATRSEARHKGIPFRSLDSYASGFYQKQLLANERLIVPVAPHVLLSACESVQLAGDMENGGVFSLGLIEALKRAKHDINYSDLYMHTRSSVQKISRKNQSPTFEVIGDFNPYRRFLEASSKGSPDIYPLLEDKGIWQVPCGAIHGIPLKASSPILLDILDEDKLLGTAELVAVGAQKSQVMPQGRLILDPEKNYKASLRFLPLPLVPVYLRGDDKSLDLLKKHWDEKKNIKWVSNLYEFDDINLEVQVENNTFLLNDIKKGKRIYSWKNDESGAKIIIDCLAKIVNWERIINLNHEKSKILSNDWVDFEIRVTGPEPEPICTIRESQSQLWVKEGPYYSQNGALYAGFFPEFIVKNCNQDLYAYFFHLRNDFSIKSYEGEVVYRSKNHIEKERVVFPMWTAGNGWGLAAEDVEDSCYFKLIVCTEPLDYHQLEQSGLDGDKSLNFKASPMAVKNDWCSITRKVSLKRT